MKLTKSISIILLFYSCANMVSPTGGEKDTTPPILVSVSENKTTTRNEVHFVFNEYIQLNNWEENFYISPPFNKKVQKKIKEKTLIISINDSIANNTTYHLSLSSSIKDLNEGNVTDSLSFFFGNTDYFDSLNLSGNIRNAYTLESIKNAWVMLFEENRNDTLIFKSPPDYIAKTNENGAFNFPNLNSTNYKIVALTNFDFIYNKGELIGFSDTLINAVTDSFISLLVFNPVLKTDSTRSDTLLAVSDSIKTDTLKIKKNLAGSLKINTKQYPSIIFQLLQDQKISYVFSFTSAPFLLNEINPGKYTLKCIIDENRDGDWTRGNWAKKTQPERVFIYPSEITIRSNWELELNWELE